MYIYSAIALASLSIISSVACGVVNSNQANNGSAVQQISRNSTISAKSEMSIETINVVSRVAHYQIQVIGYNLPKEISKYSVKLNNGQKVKISMVDGCTSNFILLNTDAPYLNNANAILTITNNNQSCSQSFKFGQVIGFSNIYAKAIQTIRDKENSINSYTDYERIYKEFISNKSRNIKGINGYVISFKGSIEMVGGANVLRASDGFNVSYEITDTHGRKELIEQTFINPWVIYPNGIVGETYITDDGIMFTWNSRLSCGTIVGYKGTKKELNLFNVKRLKGKNIKLKGDSWKFSSLKESYPIKEIAPNAFKNCGLEKIVLPQIVERIGDNAFQGNNLKEIKFLGNISEIGNNAFEGNKLETVVFNSYTIQKIGESAFANNKIDYLDLNNSINTIEKNAFKNNKLTNLTLPKNLEWIGHEAFANNLIKTLTFDNLKFLDHVREGNVNLSIKKPFLNNQIINIIYNRKISKYETKEILNKNRILFEYNRIMVLLIKLNQINKRNYKFEFKFYNQFGRPELGLLIDRNNNWKIN